MTDEEIKKLRKEMLNAISKHSKFVKPLLIKRIEKENAYQIEAKCPYCDNINNYKNCELRNKWIYGFYLVCRNCHMRFFIVSFLHKIAYKYYPITRDLRNFQKSIIKFFKKKAL